MSEAIYDSGFAVALRSALPAALSKIKNRNF